MSSSNRCKAAHQPKLTCPRRSRRVQFKTAHPNLHRRGPGPIRHRREVRHPIPILHFVIAWPYGSCGITVWVGSAPAFLLELAGYFMPTALETNSSRHIVTGPVKVARCTELNCPLNTKTIDKGLGNMPRTTSSMFIQGTGDWTLYRTKNQLELDLHLKSRERHLGPRERPYEDLMQDVHEKTLAALECAYNAGNDSVLIIHGRSTSRPGRLTSRSVVRKLMRSKLATPLIVRKHCVQHETVFVAVLKKRAVAECAPNC